MKGATTPVETADNRSAEKAYSGRTYRNSP